MKITTLALILTLATISWAQSADPSAKTPTTDKPATASASCACCDKMSKDGKAMDMKDMKEMACCKHDAKNGKSEMSCCKGKEGTEAKACMRETKDSAAGSCCTEACGKEHASCCASKEDKSQAAARCCGGGKCDRHAHEHAGGV